MVTGVYEAKDWIIRYGVVFVTRDCYDDRCIGLLQEYNMIDEYSMIVMIGMIEMKNNGIIDNLHDGLS